MNGVIVNGRVRLPKRAPDSEVAPEPLDPILEKLTARIEQSPSAVASISRSSDIRLTSAWLCKRWCSSYLLLRSVTPTNEGGGILDAPPSREWANWPSSIPSPATQGDKIVDKVNKVYPILFASTILHEIGHSVYAGRQLRGPELEFACDRFAASYLLGRGRDNSKSFAIWGVAIWQCCLCTEQLGSEQFISSTHPNPVVRLQSLLRDHVALADELGGAVWLMCVGHVLRLAKSCNRPSIDEEVLPSSYSTLPDLLSDLASCW